MTDSLTCAFTDEIATGVPRRRSPSELAPTGLALTLLLDLGARRRRAGPGRRHGRRAGLLLRGSTRRAVDWLIRRGLPLVYVDQAPVPGIPSVNVDDRGGARAAAQHLVDLGHRRVGIVNRRARSARTTWSSPPTTGDPAPHLAPADAGLDRRADRGRHRAAIVRCGSSLRAPSDVRVRRRRGCCSSCERPDRPTAILCFSDVMAYWVVRAAEDRGLRVPRGPVGRGLRRQPAGPADAPGADDGAPGRAWRRGGRRPRR